MSYKEHAQDHINFLKRRIDQAISTTGFDENFVASCKFHLQRILLQFERSNIRSREEYINILMSNLFLGKMHLFPTQRFKTQVNECLAWPLPLLPSEVFAPSEVHAETRKYVFYQCLQVGDYLECRVTSSQSSSAEYQLRVIHKYGLTRILDDLKIIVTMRKADISDLPLEKREFGICQLLRVVVIDKEEENGEIKVFVSVKHKETDLASIRPLLGAIPDTHVPKYVLNPYPSEKSTSYRDYLTGNRGFYDPVLLNGIYEAFGTNPRRTYSYFPANERLCSIDANPLLKESKLKDVNEYMEIALRDFSKGEFTYALTAINLAIKSYPKAVTEQDKAELSKLYETRGTIYASKKKLKMNVNALKDWQKAANLDRTNEAARAYLSREHFRNAMKNYKMKNYSMAAEMASKALKLNDKNVEARNLKEYLKKKHPEATDDCDEESIQALLEKHKAIGSELKKLAGEVNAPIVPYLFDSTSNSPSTSKCKT